MPAAPPNPLHDLHRQAEAEFQAYADVEVVSTFGEPPAEYAAIRKGCGLMDLPQRGVLELAGAERLDFLNRLLTNETFSKAAKSPLPAGDGVYAFFLNTKGRIVADMNVLERGDRTLLEMDARMVEPIRAAFDKYLITDDVQLTNALGSLHEIALHGPKAREILSGLLTSPLADMTGGQEANAPTKPLEPDSAAQAARPALPDLKPLQSTKIRLFDADVVVWRDDPAGVSGYYLILPADAARRAWLGLLSKFGGNDSSQGQPGRRAVRPVGWAAFNATRVEAGRPYFGIDFDDTVLPAETGQAARAVSFTKGCYLGQEIVARMHARGQVARQLVGIRMEGDALPLAGSHVYDDAGNQIGGVTSSTISPVLSNAAICLGYVKKQFLPVGTEVTIPAEGAMRNGKVTELPFVK